MGQIRSELTVTRHYTPRQYGFTFTNGIQGSLVEVVNRYGSFFYGSLLGVFMLAILTRRATAGGAFWGMIAGMAVVLTVAFSPWTRAPLL